jgi:hypothetical protein
LNRIQHSICHAFVTVTTARVFRRIPSREKNREQNRTVSNCAARSFLNSAADPLEKIRAGKIHDAKKYFRRRRTPSPRPRVDAGEGVLLSDNIRTMRKFSRAKNSFRWIRFLTSRSAFGKSSRSGTARTRWQGEASFLLGAGTRKSAHAGARRKKRNLSTTHL